MKLELFKKELLKNPGFRKEYYNSDDIAFKISLMIKKERIKQGLTQEKLAKLTGTKQSSIARLESGNNVSPSFNFLKRIADALNVDLISPQFVSKSVSRDEVYKIDLSGYNKEKKCIISNNDFVFAFNSQFTANNY